MKDQRILITGGAGFVGSHLAERLAKENDVTVIDDLSTGKEGNVPDVASFQEGDIRNKELLDRITEGVDIVFHQGAVVSVERSAEEPLPCHEVNTDATLYLLELAREKNFRLVIASSAAIYGNPEKIPISEEDSKSPTTPYGIDKWTIDRYARVYNDLYDTETVVLRYFNIYGPRQRGGDYGGVISIFWNQALAGEPITIQGDGSQTRDFIYIDDIVEANLLAATTEHTGEAYNIGRGKKTSIAELAETIHDIVDTDSGITYMEPRTGDVDESVADISKAKNELGFEPTISLRKGLKKMF
ncbi:NAD-dependent epimerase/dehydratase family protein [Halorubrum ezzemoulense]|uniref:NAD-dependent epimerase/dehydratase family protein n=1 Tax=Halorubrum ezzemoulense TaxID=337243 RepID=UPI00232C93C5|nr:NAD-dependent epimerase/dehydratase family protein [Halorubrum ezzemoulense]MDB9235526.1 NAD-dependent epimerase/dehydratase family protein [Halorubrum ezzemoulense]